MRTPAGALAAGSIGLGLSVHDGDARTVIGHLRREASAAIAAGFDGVTLSEHHGGFPGYLPNPILFSSVLMAELPHGWAVAAPAILPLRNAVAVAEDLAWLAASYPGRVAAAFVAGYQEQDFTALGVPFEARTRRFWQALGDVAQTLDGHRPDHPVAADRAVSDLRDGNRPVLLAGVGGPKGATRAAGVGAGLLITSLTSPADGADLVSTYRGAGGRAVCCLIRRVWVGAPASVDGPATAWSGRGGGASWLRGAGEELINGDAADVQGRLVAAVTASGADALNIRINVDGAAPADILRQIEVLGAEVLPGLRAVLGW